MTSSLGSQREPPPEKNLDKLSDTLMTMFGEEVEAHRVNPLKPIHAQGSARKHEMAEIKVGHPQGTLIQYLLYISGCHC